MATKMTRQQVINFITNLKGAKPATIVIETRPKMNKFARTPDENGNKMPNPYLDNIVKRTRCNVFLNVNYENSVNRQRGREDKEQTFESQQRAWGTHVSPSLVVNEGRYYLQYKLEKRFESEYIDVRNGEVIPASRLYDYLPPRKKSNTQGTDKEIIINTVKLENITHINTDGQEIEVERF